MLAATVLLGALLRFTMLDNESFWFDEALTRNTAAHGLAEGLARLPDLELTPPLYYVLVWLWARLFTLEEVGLRSFSALCGTAVIPVMWALGRQILSQRVGLIAALLIAVNPLLIWYSQEARSYSLLTLLTAVSLLALVRALRSPSNRRIALWALSCSLALCTHYFAVFIIVPQAVVLLAMAHQGRMRSKVLLGLCPIVGTAILLAPLALHQSGTDASFIARSGSLPTRVVRLIRENFVGYGAPIVDGVLFALIASLLVLIALVIRSGDSRERSVAMLLLAIGGSGVATALLLAIAGMDYFNTRNLLPTWLVFTLVIATGLGATRDRKVGVLGVAALAMLSLACVMTVVSNPQFHRADWRGAARALGPANAPRGIVSYDRSGEALQPYLRQLSTFPSKGTRIREIDVVSLREPWLGTPQHRLRAARPLAGFEFTERIETRTYVVLRYRARGLRFVRPNALQALYPNLLRRRVLLQVSGSNPSSTWSRP